MTLICGDNLTAMKEIESDSVALIYADPPFMTGRKWQATEGSESDGATFGDSWKAYESPSGELADCIMGISGFDSLFDFAQRSQGPAMANYLLFMAARLLESRRLLSPSGSIFLHCDQTASHYLKALMDSIFGPANFRNEIVWKRSQAKGSASRRFPVCTDSILFYGKSGKSTFTPIHVPYEPGYVEKFYRYKDERGLHWRGDASSPSPAPQRKFTYKGYAPPAKGWRWNRETMEKLDREGRLYFPADKSKRIAQKIYLHERKGFPIQNLWSDISCLAPHENERTGYPTQKPVALLKRIIESASAPGDIILDPFCGSGTSCLAASELGRRYIGIDRSQKAIEVAQSRLKQDSLMI